MPPIFLLFLALLQVPAQAELREAHGIFFAQDVPDSQREALSTDLSLLASLKFSDPELRQVLELTPDEDPSLAKWLTDRVHYIVAESFRLDDSIFYSANSIAYENPSVYPILDQASESVSSNAPKYVVAFNLGANIYLNGKMQNQLLQVDIPGSDLVEVHSPRVGIVQIGVGLFKPLLQRYGLATHEPSSELYRLVRLGALFHEARHSDGNGESLGFNHVRCPEGHDYAGRVVCDRAANGAYAVGGLVEKSLARQCATCTVAEREAFRLYTADSLNRVIPSAKDESGATKHQSTGFLDARPEGKR